MLEFRMLGPLEVSADGRAVEIGGPRQRALLAALLLRAGQAVPRDALIQELWGDSPPPGAQHTLDVYVSRLRKALDAGASEPVLLTMAGGYSLSLGAGQLDVLRFEQLVADGRSALAVHAPEVAAAKLTTALQLWRGPMLAELGNCSWPRGEVVRLEELRLGAIEDRIEADLALGRHDRVVGELQALVAVHPLRERLHGQLMIALYRGGRQAEALEVYQAARRTLVAELGLEPGPALRQAQRAILDHDSALEPTHEPGSAGLSTQDWAAASRSGPGRRLFALAGTTAVAAAVLVAVVAGRHNQLIAGPDSVALISAGHGGLSAVATGVGRPSGIAFGAGNVWVTDSSDDQLLRISAAGQVIDRIPVGRGPAGVTAGDGEIWVTNELDGTVSEVNPGAGTQVATIGVGIGPAAIAFGYGSVWVANMTSDSLSRIDAATGGVTATIPLGSAPNCIAVGAGAVWVTSQDTGELVRIDPADNHASLAVTIGQRPSGVAVGGGSVWIADAGGTLSRLFPRTGKIRKISLGGSPAGIAYAGGAAWVADSPAGTLWRVDPATGASRVIHLGNEPTDLAAAGHDIWATVLPSLTSHRGGTLTVLSQPVAGHFAPPTDPALAYDTVTWQMLSMTNDGLVGYRRVTGLAGNELVPDLATALPDPTDGGRTYTFHLRTGIRYSTGAVVEPEDFRRAIERVFVVNRNQGLGIMPFYADIVGATRCEQGQGPCNLAEGIVANDAAETVTFHLVAPDPDFLYDLAFSWADAVPAGTPEHPISAAALPATGPYMTESLLPGHAWVLVRNPRFRQWSAPAQPDGYPDRIVLRLNVAANQAVADVEHGGTDVLLSPPADSIGQLATHYTSQLHSGPLPATIALTLNTGIAPFDKLAARRAVNDAVDRNEVIALNGGPLAAQPTCQVLPPTMPGYRPYCPYTDQPSASGAWTAPNMALAERLVLASGTRGDKVTVLASHQGDAFPSTATGRYVVSVLDQLGYRATLRVTSVQAYYGLLGDSHDHVQAGFFSWYEDFPDARDFIDPLLTCRSFLPGNPDNLNTAEFCDPRIDRLAALALSAESDDPGAATARWAAIDRALVDQAPWVPLYNPRDLSVLSPRIGDYQFHPYWSLLIDQLWVR
jgi:YVTN family beta-propeller protein